MREIKFRAWDKSNKKFAVIELTNGSNCKGHIHTLQSATFGNQNIVWQQYTGLKDKNGVEIYEGDIVAWKSNIALDKPDEKAVVEIDISALNYMRSYPAINSTSEIIGNIYENPELLR